MRDEPQRVVILYSHPLLGEGIARLLSVDDGLRVELVRVDEPGAAENALVACPDVVILERNSPLQAIDLLRFAPSALFIDVSLDTGPSWALRRDELSPQPEEILRAIRQRRRRRRADAGTGCLGAAKPARVTTVHH